MPEQIPEAAFEELQPELEDLPETEEAQILEVVPEDRQAEQPGQQACGHVDHLQFAAELVEHLEVVPLAVLEEGHIPEEPLMVLEDQEGPSAAVDIVVAAEDPEDEHILVAVLAAVGVVVGPEGKPFAADHSEELDHQSLVAGAVDNQTCLFLLRVAVELLDQTESERPISG